MTSALRASAPAKVLLLGEYAVLAGHPALGCALDARLTCTLTPRDDGVVRVVSDVLDGPAELPLGEVLWDEPPDGDPLTFVRACLRSRGEALARGLALRIDGFPTAWGVGSSSAVVVALLAGLRALAGELVPAAASDPTDPAALLWEGREIVRLVQGKGSGADVAFAALGGWVHYRDGLGRNHDVLERVPAPPADAAQLIVAYTGRSASTTELIRKVRPGDPAMAPLLAEAGELAARGVLAARDGRWDELGALLDEGQRWMMRLGVVPPDLGEALESLRDAPGVLGAKLTGAGGGDVAAVLASDRGAAERACRAAGLEPLPLTPSADGAIVEELS